MAIGLLHERSITCMPIPLSNQPYPEPTPVDPNSAPVSPPTSPEVPQPEPVGVPPVTPPEVRSCNVLAMLNLPHRRCRILACTEKRASDIGRTRTNAIDLPQGCILSPHGRRTRMQCRHQRPASKDSRLPVKAPARNAATRSNGRMSTASPTCPRPTPSWVVLPLMKDV